MTSSPRVYLQRSVVAEGRALVVAARVSQPPSTSREGNWSWCATLRVADRISTAGNDSYPDQGPLAEQELHLALWLPYSTEPMPIELQVDVHEPSTHSSWTGRAELTGEGAPRLELAPSAPLSGAPFDQPVGRPAELYPRPRPSQELPGTGRLILDAATAEADFVLERLDGTRTPLPIPRRDPQKHGGHFQRVLHRAPDDIALFRDHAEGRTTMTLTKLSAPQRATFFDCFFTCGGFNPEGTRLWYARTPNVVAIVNVSTAVVEGELYVDSLSTMHLAGDYLFRYEAAGRITARSWTTPTSESWQVPNGLAVVDFAPRIGKMAWSKFIGSGGALGARSAVSWLDLTTFEGGEVIIADRIESVRVTPDGNVIASNVHGVATTVRTGPP